MSNDELYRAWDKIRSEGALIALIEDIDSVFHGRELVNRNSQKTLTFDALLNCISGVQVARGVLLFVTTNHLDRVDSALWDRPGRIDRVIDVGPLGVREKIQIGRKILQDLTLPDGMTIESLAAGTEGMTAARFVEECRRIAVRCRRERVASGGPYRS